MNPNISKKVIPLVNQIFPQSDLGFKYKVKKIIGKGQYGYVAKALQKKDNKLVAIKKLFNIFHNQSETKRILRQIILLKNCNHPNIITLIEVFIPKTQNFQNFDQIYIVTEYCDTDLRKLFKLEDIFLELSDVKFILYQIVCGIKYLHSASIIHRDLTPNNILINGNGMGIKICDLGLARIIEENKSQKQSQQNIENSSDQDNYQQFSSSKSSKQIDLTIIQQTKSQLNEQNNTQNSQIIKNAEFKQQNTSLQLIKQETQNQQQQIQYQKTSQLQRKLSQKNQPNKKKKKLSRMNTSRNTQSQTFNHSKNEKQQQNSKKQKKFMRNPLAKLTLRVTTRWYRAPQLILLQKGYSKPIDIWSLGCLFGQLLKMMKSVCYNSVQRFPLFPGKYCYPVSPQTLNNISKQSNNQCSNYKNDQLFMILSTIGKPTQEQMGYLTDEAAKQYIRSIQNLERKQFKKFFPTSPIQAIDILQKTLLFNPLERMSIEQFLSHPFFNDIRNKQVQKQATPIIMKFQQEQHLNMQKLKQYLTNQIKLYL